MIHMAERLGLLNLSANFSVRKCPSRTPSKAPAVQKDPKELCEQQHMAARSIMELGNKTLRHTST